MQQVGHDLFCQRAIGLGKLRTDVEEEYHFVVGQLGNDLVRLRVELPGSVVGIGAARKYGQQQDLHLRQLGPQLLDNRFDSLGRSLRLCSRPIVRADHHYGQLRRDAIEVSVIEPPQDVLRLVAANAQIDRMPLFVVLFPHIFAAAFPALSDRVANKNKLCIPLFYPGVDLLLPLLPPSFIHRRGRDGHARRRFLRLHDGLRQGRRARDQQGYSQYSIALHG